jgi:hypothetical protein
VILDTKDLVGVVVDVVGVVVVVVADVVDVVVADIEVVEVLQLALAVDLWPLEIWDVAAHLLNKIITKKYN